MDAMDVDWCLTCNKQTSHGKPYCSRACRRGSAESTDAMPGEFNYTSDDASSASDVPRDSPSRLHKQRPPTSSRRRSTPASSLLHPPRRSRAHHHAPQQQFLDAEKDALARWPGYGNEAGIRAWANAIPANSTAVEASSVGLGLSYSYARPEFPLSQQRPAGPALCTDATHPARSTVRSSSPISLPSPRGADSDVQGSYSLSSFSLVSALTESFATPESVRPRHTKTQVLADKSGRSGVLEGLARRFRSWGASPGGLALKPYSPAEIFMQTTTTTVPATPSPESSSAPIHRSTTANSNSKNSASGFTARGDAECDDDDEEQQQQQQQRTVFEVRLPLKGLRSSLAIGDAEIKESLPSNFDSDEKERQRRGVWIAGREKAEKGWAGFGPAHYERHFRECMSISEDERSEREFREFEAWNARGRKAVRR